MRVSPAGDEVVIAARERTEARALRGARLETPIHPDNRRYLAAKAARSGQRLEHLMASLTNQSG
jgi:hypothetical protein